jgi:Beta-ketoacyl synthase, N-terminal domain
LSAVFIDAVGLAAPGLPSWQEGRATLRGETAFVPVSLSPHTPAMLPINERRRATPTIRLAFRAAEDAMKGTALPVASLATVFASSDADLAIIHRICLSLAATPRLISPTHFHNSVHNAAAGYWSIAAGAREASTTISAHDGSCAAGLFEACSQVLVDGADVLLVAFDLPAPEPLLAKRPMTHPVATALVLTRQATAHSIAAMSCRSTAEAETTFEDIALEELRLGNPAARLLPLIQMLAQQRFGSVVLPLRPGANLAVELGSP